MYNNLSVREITSFIYNVTKPFRRSVSVMCIVAIIWAIDLSFRPYLLKIIIDRITETSTQNLFTYVRVPVSIYFFMTMLSPTIFRFHGYFVEIKMIPNLRLKIANASFSALLKQSYFYYQNNFAGSLTNKINDLTASIPEIIEIVINRFFSHILAIIIAIITLGQVNFIFGLGMIIWCLIFILSSIVLSKKLSILAYNWSEYRSTITGKIVDRLSNILAIRLFVRSKEEHDSLAETFKESVVAEQKLQWAYFWMWVFYGYSFVLVQGISLYFLLRGRQEGWITVGDFVIVLSINFAIVDILWRFATDFSKFSTLWGKTTQALKSIQKIPDIQDKPAASSLNVNSGQIVFDKVTFQYKDTDPQFKDLSVTIESGQKVGLVGYSGSGKTTFVNLILRLFDVSEGQILIDSQNITDVTQDSLRNFIGVIPQDPSLFHRSLMENIKYGKTDASDEEVIEAAKRAHAHEFIVRLPENYSSLAGERGVKISGGQRQRISIARAILKNAPILIMDEATSQLDTITESYIQEALVKLMQGKTSLVIAHRLSTLLYMDRILVFDKGNIVEDGTHQELLMNNGLYQTLWNAQLGGFLPNQKINVA